MLSPKQWVLVIEDEKELQDLMSEELAKNGFSVITCAKAVEAIRILRNQKFDCVVLDMRLDGGSGSQIIFSIRDDKLNPNHTTDVIVVSGQLSVDLVLKIKNSVSGVFVKPFDLNTLVTKVKSRCHIQ